MADDNKVPTPEMVYARLTDMQRALDRHVRELTTELREVSERLEKLEGRDVRSS